MWFDQADYDVRLEWGRTGLEALLDVTDVVVIVDVLSFSTCVDVAASNGALVFPFAETGYAARSFAERLDAVCAGRRGEERYSLSPRTFASAPRGARIVLPSPNGASLSLGTGHVTTLSACLRNATTVAREAQHVGKRITVIAARRRPKQDNAHSRRRRRDCGTPFWAVCPGASSSNGASPMTWILPRHGT